MTTPQKYAFIDRDGTLIFEPQDTYQIDTLEKLQILPGAIEGLQALMAADYRLVMISNQDGLGTEAFPRNDFEIPHQAMLTIFDQHGIEFDHVLICPHLPGADCACRKPKTGLVEEALGSVELTDASFVCGDRDTDRQLATNMCITFAPVRTNSNFLDAIYHFVAQ